MWNALLSRNSLTRVPVGPMSAGRTENCLHNWYSCCHFQQWGSTTKWLQTKPRVTENRARPSWGFGEHWTLSFPEMVQVRLRTNATYISSLPVLWMNRSEVSIKCLSLEPHSSLRQKDTLLTSTTWVGQCLLIAVLSLLECFIVQDIGPVLAQTNPRTELRRQR